MLPKRGYREGENPARWLGHIAQILPARTRLSRGHHKALPYEGVSAFIGEIRAREALAALALEFVILIATRTSVVLARNGTRLIWARQSGPFQTIA